MVVERPGDRWPFVVVPRPYGEAQTRHTYSGGQRLLITYVREGSARSGSLRRTDIGPQVHVFWSSPGLQQRWDEMYRSIYHVSAEGLTGCWPQSVMVERPASGFDNGYVRVSSTERAVSVYIGWDVNDVEGGLTAEDLEAAGQAIVRQLEPRASACR